MNTTRRASGRRWPVVLAGALVAVLVQACAVHAPGETITLDVDLLWDFGNPALSEERFRAALAQQREPGSATALLLRTQIARTYSLRRRFDEAERELAAVQARLDAFGPAAREDAATAELRVRWLQERGRTLRSAGNPAQALPLFEQAAGRARSAGLQALAADAMHMVALALPGPEQRVQANRDALAYVGSASDSGARRWTGALQNNLGHELRELGRLDEALAAFAESRRAYEAQGRAAAERIARWQMAKVLRLQGCVAEAREMQRALRSELGALGQADPYVDEELRLLAAAAEQVPAATRCSRRP